MNPKLSSKTLDKIESLCGLGCTRVNQILEESKNGNEVAELNGFDATEKGQIISELDQIMSVYVED